MLRPTHPELRVPQCGIYQARPSSAVIGGVRRVGRPRWGGDGGAGGERQKMKLDKLNATAKRKKELEKANKRSADRTTANEGKQSRVALYNNKGALIGWLSYEAGGKVEIAN